MKKSIKSISVALVIAMLFSLCAVSVSALDTEQKKVEIIIENNVYSVEDGAVWDGVLVDEWVQIDETSTIMTAVIDALNSKGYEQSGAENNYIESINGLSAFDGGSMSVWMYTLNDWFANQGAGAFTVADNTFQSGDVVRFMYTQSYGEDIGGSWGNNDTSLKSLSFDNGSMSPAFSKDQSEYTLTLPAGTKSIMVNPTAENKNFQIRVYKNLYTPTVNGSEYKTTQQISVTNGDTIFVGVGNENWPSMNTAESESVYMIKINIEQIQGDVNGDGVLDITDCTLIQQHLANIGVLTAEQQELADVNNNGTISILDVTTLQMKIAE